MDEIINRVKESGLITIDLADYKPKKSIMDIDIADQLWQRLVLKEKDFRDWVKSHDWAHYEGCAVYIHCSVEAIIPTWAYMLVGSKLEEHHIDFVLGSKEDIEKKLILNCIQGDDIETYKDGRVIIKGCSDISCPEYAMTELIKFLQPVVKSIMYGEPCSTVPIFKKK